MHLLVSTDHINVMNLRSMKYTVLNGIRMNARNSNWRQQGNDWMLKGKTSKRTTLKEDIMTSSRISPAGQDLTEQSFLTKSARRQIERA